jgi:hypothetical protein
VHVQVEERRFEIAATDRYAGRKGWTQHQCNSLYGHEQCLVSRRRGVHAASMEDPADTKHVRSSPPGRSAHCGSGRRMTLDQVRKRIDELSELADERRRECGSQLATLMGDASIDFLDRAERQELHELQLQLPTFAELREQASARIRQRIAD